jgi:hypothetical protein
LCTSSNGGGDDDDDEMGMACRKPGRDEKCVKYFSWKM